MSAPLLGLVPSSLSSAAARNAFASPIVETPTPIGKFVESNETISRFFNWDYKGTWSLEIRLPVSLYDYYRSLPRSPTRNYSVYVTHPLDKEYVQELTDKLEAAAESAHFTGRQKIEFVAAFVQNLPYTVDNITTKYDEYPRYPIETLVDNGGDCEDTSVLLAAILKKMGYEVILISPPNHFGVGVRDTTGNMSGTYWVYKGANYYYIETTGNKWRVGMVPDEYKNSAAYVFPVVPVPILTHAGNFTGNKQVMQVNLKVSNLGTATASNVTVLAGFEAGSYMLWNAEQSNTFALGRDQQSVVRLQLRVPPREHTRLVVQIIINGVLFDESRSGWFDT